MPELISVDIANIIKRIVPILKQREEVVGAYLFGSILGPCRRDSDIDLGLVLSPDIKITEKAAEKLLEEITNELSPVDNHYFDIIVLNRSSAIFAYKVITQGKEIYAVDADAVTDFMERVSRKRAEDYPRYRQALEAIAGR